MLELTIGQPGKVIVTLNELKTLDAPYYLFVFESTKETVKVIKAYTDDESDYTARYNQFTIESALFENSQNGEWHYSVYEQESPTDEDPANGNLLEKGKLILYPATESDTVKYDSPQTYKVYNG